MELQMEYRQSQLEHNLVLKVGNYENNYYKNVMIQKNHIPGLLKVKIIMLDDYKHFQYNITNKNSLVSESESHKISYCQMDSIRKSLIEVSGYLAEYLLDMNDLILKPEYIFIEPKTWEVNYCYLPGLQENPLKGVCGLVEYLVKVIDHQDKRAVELGYEMYHISSKTNFCLQDFEELRTPELTENKEFPKIQVKNERKDNEKGGSQENNYKRNIKAIVIIGVISIIILVVGIILYLTYMGYQLF